jgi:hypothetical protein
MKVKNLKIILMKYFTIVLIYIVRIILLILWVYFSKGIPYFLILCYCIFRITRLMILFFNITLGIF